MRRKYQYWLIILACLVAMAGGGYGQNRPPLARDEGMERMAEILGAMHYLDNLCKGKSEEWRNFMDRLIVTENAAPPQRQRLVAAFNRTYRAFAENHHQCTQATLEAMKLYRQEGQVLSEDLVNRYGN